LKENKRLSRETLALRTTFSLSSYKTILEPGKAQIKDHKKLSLEAAGAGNSEISSATAHDKYSVG